MDKTGEGVACLVRAKPERVPGGSERRGLGHGLRSCLGQSLGLGAEPWAWGSVDGGVGEGGGSLTLMTPGLKEGECGGPFLWEPQVLGEVGRGHDTRILV